MTGDQLIRPHVGTAAGVPYVALPPTAVDVGPDGPVRLVAVWHGFDPPRTETAMCAAVPMTGVPAWRVYLRLPMPVGWPPPGRDDSEAYAQAAERAAELFPTALDEVRTDLSVEEGPIGLAGIAAGAGAALLILADDAVPVAAAALIAPLVAPMVASVDTDGTGEPPRHLAALPSRIARRDTALLLIGGVDDPLVTPASLDGLRDALRAEGLRTVETATFRMGHELATEPGTDAEPPTAEAVSVDGALTDWFRERLGTRPLPAAASTQTTQTTETADAGAAAGAAADGEPDAVPPSPAPEPPVPPVPEDLDEAPGVPYEIDTGIPDDLIQVIRDGAFSAAGSGPGSGSLPHLGSGAAR